MSLLVRIYEEDNWIKQIDRYKVGDIVLLNTFSEKLGTIDYWKKPGIMGSTTYDEAIKSKALIKVKIMVNSDGEKYYKEI
jgi:hypothetical protein